MNEKYLISVWIYQIQNEDETFRIENDFDLFHATGHSQKYERVSFRFANEITYTSPGYKKRLWNLSITANDR
jgi:hypothetical protein